MRPSRLNKINKFRKFIFKTTVILIFFSCYLSQGQQKNAVIIMTTNIRYANPNDGINIWDNRKDWLCNFINFTQADLIGGQEVIHKQLNDMAERLPLYSHIGIGRNGGTQGEYCPIFYKTDTFKLLDSDTFWLSKTPNQENSKGWDAALPRIVTWAKFKHKPTDKIMYFFNTHFDHKGKQARFQSAKLLMKKVKEIAGDHPLFITGDFNFTPSVEAYDILTKDNPSGYIVQDGIQSAKLVYGPKYTTNGFNLEPDQSRDRIDYVFFKGDIGIEKHHTVDGQRGPRFISDHFPIVVQARFK